MAPGTLRDLVADLLQAYEVFGVQVVPLLTLQLAKKMNTIQMKQNLILT
jgi:hypothetical protein